MASIALTAAAGFGRSADAERIGPASAASRPASVPGRTVAAEPSGPAASAATRKSTVSDAGSPASRSASPTDEALLEAVAAGDRAAMRTLVERYEHELLNFLTRFLGSRAAGEDVFQEAFLQVWMSADTFDPTRRFKPWLFTIAANKARDHHRRHARRQMLSLSAPVSGPGGEADASFADLMAGPDPDPGDPVHAEELRDRVRTAVDGLPPHLREILLLSYFQRMSYAQVAGTLGIPLGTVKSRLHAAVGAFARAWQDAERKAEGARPESDAAIEHESHGGTTPATPRVHEEHRS